METKNNSKENFKDYLSNLIATLSTSDTKSTDSRFSELSLKFGIENEIKEFYVKNLKSFLKDALSNDTNNDLLNSQEKFELNNEKSFKLINKFSKSIAQKLDTKSSTIENKSSHQRLEVYDYLAENKRLGELLESKRIKNEEITIHNSDDEYDESDDECMNDLIRIRKLNETSSDRFFDTYAKKYNINIDKHKLKQKVAKSLYNRALFNAEKSKKLNSLPSCLRTKYSSRSSKITSQLLNEESANKLMFNKAVFSYANSNVSDISNQKNKINENNELKICRNPYNSTLQIFFVP
jgi:hypothetical protein